MSEFRSADHAIKVQGGAVYIPVQPRLSQFRQDHPTAAVENTMIHYDSETVVFRSVIRLDNGAMGTGHAAESLTAKKPYSIVETCETSAQGRALASIGYGTLDMMRDGAASGERIVDSPVVKADAPRQVTITTNPSVASTPSLPATDKQMDFLRSTAKGAGWDDEQLSLLLIERTNNERDLSRKEASQMIDQLKSGSLKPNNNGVDRETGEIVGFVSDWTEFWTKAKERGLKTKTEVSTYLGYDISNMSDPSIIWKSIQEKEGAVTDGTPF
jgi:hypothetical protein